MGRMERTQVSGVWYVPIVAGCFLFGGVFGCLLGSLAGDAGLVEIEEYLRDFLVLTHNREVVWTVPSVLWNRSRWLLCCGVFALSAAGIAIIPILFGFRGFLLAFGVSSFVRVFGAVGLLPAALLLGVPALLWVPGFFVLGVMCLRRSARSLRKGETTQVPGMHDAGKRICIAGLFLVLCVIFECGLLPRLLSAAAGILV